MKFQAIKGVRDILPPESAVWNRVEQIAREVFGTYGYAEIRLPIFEPTELFARSIGEETDVVSKEMYTWEDHEHPELEALRGQILLRQPNINQPLAMELFRHQVADFLDGANEGLRKGTIPRTPLNLRIATDAEVMLNHMFQEQTAQGLANDLTVSLKDMLAKFEIGDRLTLRPEATASVVRAYVQNGMQTLPSPIKLYYAGPMFRRERPQKGRYRQFYQIGAEVLGPNISHFSIDAEVITMLMNLFDRCGLAGHVLYINSIGCKECRPKYIQELRIALDSVRESLGADSQRRIETNPLRVLDSKAPQEQEVIDRLPMIADRLCEECREHFEGLKTILRNRGVQFKVNPRLVRGLDYYVRTTFEVTAPGQGSQDAICGGGRYDGLVELIGGAKFRDIKGVGFAIGEDRLIEALRSEGISTTPHVDVLVAWKDQSSREHAEKIAQALRLAGLAVEVPVKPMSPGEGLGLANRRRIPIGVVIGPGEVSAAAFSVRMLSEGDQVSLTQSQLGQISSQLLRFRLVLERELEETAIVHGIEHKGMSLTQLASKLTDAGILDASLRTPISMANDTFNRVIHGEQVDQLRQSEAVAACIRVLDEMSGSSPQLRFRIGLS